MAREYGRLLTSIGADPDYRQLEPLEQWLYKLLLARKDINHAGVIQYNPTQWARESKGATPQLIDDQMHGLIYGGFLVYDEVTGEVLVRSLMRNDGIAKQPNMLVSACRYAVQVESDAVRAVLARELRRIAADPQYRLNRPASVAVNEAVSQLDPDGPPPPPIVERDDRASGSGNPSGKGSGKSSRGLKGTHHTGVDAPLPYDQEQDTETPQTEGFAEVIPDVIPEPQGVGEGVGVGNSRSPRSSFQEKSSSSRAPAPARPCAPARAREKPPQPPHESVDLVRDALPAAVTPRTEQALARHTADALDRGTSRTAITAAITEWARRTNRGPGLLPSLIDDAVLSAHVTSPAAPASRPALHAVPTTTQRVQAARALLRDDGDNDAKPPPLGELPHGRTS